MAILAAVVLIPTLPLWIDQGHVKVVESLCAKAKYGEAQGYLIENGYHSMPIEQVREPGHVAFVKEGMISRSIIFFPASGKPLNQLVTHKHSNAFAFTMNSEASSND